MLNRIHNVDCLEGLSRLAEGSVDLCFADPPFNIGYDYDVYDDHRKADEYLAWSRTWIAAVVRALKPNGTFWLAIGDEYAAELKVLCTRELGLHCRSWVIWFYTFGVHCTQKFTRSHAHLFHFVKDPANFTFNSLSVRVPSARELVYGDKRADPNGRVPDDTWLMTPVLPPEVPTKDGFILRPQDVPERFPPHSDTWYFSRVAGTFAERRGWHGCQMPEQLLGRIMRACSNERDLVLDPFGGSGTTLAVAKKLNRQFVGFELSLEYARQIDERLASIGPGDPLTGPENPVTSAPRTNAGRKLNRNTRSDSEQVSRSPVVTKANVSLGQIAVASGEFTTAVGEAFMTAHQGYSADRLIADPALNGPFLDSCKLLGIPGGPKDWNHLLLNLRKRGGLSAIDTSRRTIVKAASADDILYASELAWKSLAAEKNCSLDDILCDPSIAAEFDGFCRRISPGFGSFEYRWGALAVRKRFQISPESVAARRPTLLRNSPVKIATQNQLPSAAAQFLLSTSGERTHIFTGFVSDCRTARILTPKYLELVLEFLGIGACKPSEVLCRFSRAGADRKLRRAEVVRACQPVGNLTFAN
jgi:DNA modification methylase